MSVGRIIEFLIKAKRRTYAGKGPEVNPSRPASHDLQYAEGDLLYIDTYLGGYKFAGEEALWKKGQPFWAMNYCGRTISNEFDGDFLKEALLNAPSEKPFRGPEKYIKGAFTYQCFVDGDFKWFSGYEEIHKENMKVYECIFHGGEVI